MDSAETDSNPAPSLHAEGSPLEDRLGPSSATQKPAKPDEVQRIYRHRFDEADRSQKAGVWKVVVEDFLARWISPQDAVLDVGCGFGEFLNHVACKRRVGIDLNSDSAEALDTDIEFHVGDVRDLGFLAEGEMDVVFTSNLLEHLPSKEAVAEVVCEARRVLRPGGSLIALGPNLRYLPGQYWDFWDHHTAITDRSLVELLEIQDFEIVDHHARFLPYTTRSALPQALWLVKLYLRIPLVWRLMGKQFLIRARKP